MPSQKKAKQDEDRQVSLRKTKEIQRREGALSPNENVSPVRQHSRSDVKVSIIERNALPSALGESSREAKKQKQSIAEVALSGSDRLNALYAENKEITNIEVKKVDVKWDALLGPSKKRVEIEDCEATLAIYSKDDYSVENTYWYPDGKIGNYNIACVALMVKAR